LDGTGEDFETPDLYKINPIEINEKHRKLLFKIKLIRK